MNSSRFRRAFNLGENQVLKSIHKFVGVVTAAIILAAASFSPALAGSNKLSGAWSITVIPDGAPFTIPNVATMTSDGLVNNSDPTFGAGHGVWEKVGPGSYAISFLHIVDASLSPVPPVNGANVFITVDGLLTINRGGDLATGPTQTTFRDSDGNILVQIDGTVELARYSLSQDVSLFGEYFMTNRRNKNR